MVANPTYHERQSPEDHPFERIPPQSLEAEQAVLGDVLVAPSDFLSDVIGVLRPDDFYRQAHQLVYEAILALTDSGEPVDVITVSEWLDGNGYLEAAGGRSYVNDLALSALGMGNTAHYVRIIREKSMNRQLIHVGTEIVVQAYEDEPKAMEFAQQEIFRLAQQGTTSTMSGIKDVVASSLDLINERRANPGTLMGVSTGFYDLDTYTSGLQKSDLLILAARPSMGKTGFALNIASHVALRERKHVLIFSLEMDKVQLATRMLSSLAEVDAQRIRSGEISDEQFNSIQLAAGQLGNAPISIDDAGGLTVAELRTRARKVMMEEGELGLVIIDYLQLMEGASDKAENRTTEVSAISRGLKSIARELRCPVLALSQLSRAVESRQDKKPMLSDLRESGAIEQDADLVMFIYRDEYYNKDSERQGLADIIIAKQRNGPVGDIELLYRSNLTKFMNKADRDIRIF